MFGGLAQPAATRKQLHHAATQAGLRVSLQGLDQRFNQAAVEFMRQLLEIALTEAVTGEGAEGVLPYFNGVYLTDCTRLVWGEAGVKLALRLELQRGRLQACLTDLQQHDQKAEVVERPLPSGALHLGDLGFFKLKRFRDWSADGVFWLTRYKVGTRLQTLEGQSLELNALLAGRTAFTLPVRLGSGSSTFSAYLVAAPLSEEAFAKRQTRLKDQVRRDQHPLSKRQSDLSHWTLYLTNVPHLSFEQAHILARARWQIELLFKLWKSHGNVLCSRSADPLRQQCEGYAKLLAVLVAHWTLLVAGWQHNHLSPLDALRILRTHVPSLLHALTSPRFFDDFFRKLSLDLDLAPPLSKRRKAPRAFQLWSAFETSFP